ncbi:hypothetical protein FB107DRAFT_274148 [Schizophyllum commune]
MEAERPEKRQRTDEGPLDVVRSDIWFDDGNIILQAGGHQFRVYRGLLARHSPVFKDMFAMPQPSGNSSPAAQTDDCPIIHLADSADDVHFMLTKLYNISDTEDNRRQALDISDLIASLRMGHKYLIARLWNDPVNRLRRAFPADEDLLMDCLKEDKDISSSRCATEIRIPSSENLLQLVHAIEQVGLQTVLPALYYRIILRETLDTIIVGGFGLSDRARAALLGGRARLSTSVASVLRTWGRLDPHATSVNSQCWKARYDYVLDNASGRLPIGPWTENLSPDMCLQCRTQLSMALTLMRSKAWAELPTIFGLPPWADLHDFEI